MTVIERGVIHAPEPVGDSATLFSRLRARAGGAPVALGLDLPLGLPRAYARSWRPEPDFPAFLRALAAAPASFLNVADTLEEAGPDRPFYPRRGRRGMTRAAHAAALGLDGPGELCRACDRGTRHRPAGAPVFWTLGANQSGKAAIDAWAGLLLPALSGPHPPRLWPFEGPFRALLAPGGVALAETYPAEAAVLLGLARAGSKRRQADRAARAPALLAAIEAGGATPTEAMRRAIEDGFGADAAGEDRFDSLLGVLCVQGVLAGRFTDAAPDDPWIRRWEGWVLGQPAPG